MGPTMNRFLAIILLVGLTLLPGTGMAADPGKTDFTPEQQAVIDAVKNGPVGIESDFDAWADGYARDWTYWRLGAKETRPRGTHMALVRDFVEAGNRVTGFELEPVDVVIRGDIAMLRLIATETFVSTAGETSAVRYASASMLTREEGRWKVLATNILYLDD